MKHLAIFVSGSGTNMQNIIEHIQSGKIPGVEASLVISDNSQAGALEKAKKLGVETVVIDRKKFASKPEFEADIIRHLEKKHIDLIALAGFMKILSPEFVQHFRGRMINIHPSLLPAFPGGHAIKDAFEAKAKESGVTVHFVDEGVDTGPVILQEKLPVAAGETLESLEAKIHQLEYKIYPEALRRVVAGEVRLPQHHHEDEFWTND